MDWVTKYGSEVEQFLEKYYPGYEVPENLKFQLSTKQCLNIGANGTNVTAFRTVELNEIIGKNDSLKDLVLHDWSNLRCLKLQIDNINLFLPKTLIHLDITFVKGFTKRNITEIACCTNLQVVSLRLPYACVSFSVNFQKFWTRRHHHLNTFFFTKHNRITYQENDIINVCNGHTEIKNFAVALQCSQTSVVSSTFMRSISKLLFLEFLYFKNLSFFTENNVRICTEVCFGALQHLYLDGCTQMTKDTFQYLLKATPNMHNFLLRNTIIPLEEFGNFIKTHPSLTRVSFSAFKFEPESFTPSKAIEYLMQFNSEKLENFCLCGFVREPNFSMNTEQLREVERVREVLANLSTCTNHYTCSDECNVYYSTDLVCNCNLPVL